MFVGQATTQLPGAPPGPSPKLLEEYRRRCPEQTVLYQCVQENYRSFVALYEEQDRVLPAFVRREFEKYLACGRLSEGFARIRCGDCGYDRLCGFSCKTRSWCPGCLGPGAKRRCMNDGAAYLVDCVLGDTRVRHWVLSLPPPLRHLLAYEPSLVSEVLGAFLDAVFQHLRWKAKRVLGLASVTEAHPGAVTPSLRSWIQRCSSNLSLNPHFHSLVTDGVFLEEPDGTVVFRELPEPTDEEVTRVATETCRRAQDILSKRGLRQDEPEPGLQEFQSDCDPALGDLYTKGLRGVISLGPNRRFAPGGQRVVRLYGCVTPSSTKSPEVPPGTYGFDLHARQAIRGGNREALERLARYILHPPLAQSRLERGPDGKVVLHMKRAWRDDHAS